MAADGLTDMSILPTHWYYNTESGQLTQGNNLDNLGNNLVGGAGWHELTISGSATAAQATAEAEKEFPKGVKPTTAGITPGRVASVAAGEAGGSLKDVIGISGISGTNLAIRAAKIIIGGALLIVGVAHLTGADQKTGTLIAKAVKAAPLL